MNNSIPAMRCTIQSLYKNELPMNFHVQPHTENFNSTTTIN